MKKSFWLKRKSLWRQIVEFYRWIFPFFSFPRNPNNGADGYIRSRSISEPEINFGRKKFWCGVGKTDKTKRRQTFFADKSAIYTNRFKSQNFPFEYIAVDDLHYYRRRKPCNHTTCNKSVVSFLLCFSLSGNLKSFVVTNYDESPFFPF